MDESHNIARKIVDFAKQHMGIIMEDLKGIRKRIHYGRMLNRRLHSWNFRKLQSYIDYKAKLNCIPVEYLNPKHTSSLCPMCGEKLAPNEHRLLKCRCGYENGRDVTACLNLLRMRGALLSQKAVDEAFKAEMERIVIKSNYPTTEKAGVKKKSYVKIKVNENGIMIEPLEPVVDKYFGAFKITRWLKT